MNELKKKFSILISEDDADYQFLFKMAISEVDPLIEINLVYTGEQLLEYLVKDDLYRDLNRQLLPDIIISDLKSPFFELNDIKKIRAYEPFSSIPIYLFVENGIKTGNIEEIKRHVTEIYEKPYMYRDLKKIVDEILKKNQKKAPPIEAFCSRCDDLLEYDNADTLYSQIKLSWEEINFINAKFEQPLCIACLNQLKTSYRIINGDDSVGTKVLR
jgi:DNA-binding NtrC family response regulator